MQSFKDKMIQRDELANKAVNLFFKLKDSLFQPENDRLSLYDEKQVSFSKA